MRSIRSLLLLAAFAALASPAAAAQGPPPPGAPSNPVHLVTATPAQEPALLAAVADFNHGFAEQGCASCAYHVFKMFAGTPGRFNYLMEGDWPSPEQYAKLHSSALYRDETARNPVMSALSRSEFYGRFVELKAGGFGRVASLDGWPAGQP